MSHSISECRPFRFGDLLCGGSIYKARANSKIELTTSPQIAINFVPFVSRSEENNSVDCYVSADEVQDIEGGNAITIGDTTSTIAYQPKPFATGDHIVVIRAPWLNVYTGLYITTLLRRERYRYSYGRAFLMESIANTRLFLPSTSSRDVDWTLIEHKIKLLSHKQITTRNKNLSKITKLTTQNWRSFLLHRIFYAEMGNGIDAVLTTTYAPKYNYVSRDSNGNGVVGFVDEIEGETPFPAGAMTLALGGSFLGSCFIQYTPFYTAQNVGVLKEKVPLSNYTKLFIATLIRNECKIKYQAFGRELNAHFRKDFTLKLPIQCVDGDPIIDETKEFSDDGYIPDWQWMKDYIKSLPYGDRI